MIERLQSVTLPASVALVTNLSQSSFLGLAGLNGIVMVRGEKAHEAARSGQHPKGARMTRQRILLIVLLAWGS
jgi:hypothetical protein